MERFKTLAIVILASVLTFLAVTGFQQDAEPDVKVETVVVPHDVASHLYSPAVKNLKDLLAEGYTVEASMPVFGPITEAVSEVVYLVK